MKLSDLIVATCTFTLITTNSYSELKKYESASIKLNEVYSQRVLLERTLQINSNLENMFYISDEEREELSKKVLRLNGKIIGKQLLKNIEEFSIYYPTWRRIIKRGEKIKNELNDTDFGITKDKKNDLYSFRGGRRVVFEGFKPGAEFSLRGELFQKDIGEFTLRFSSKSKIKYERVYWENSQGMVKSKTTYDIKNKDLVTMITYEGFIDCEKILNKVKDYIQ